MAEISRTGLKAYFKRGRKPKEVEYADVFDSFFHKTEDEMPMNKVAGLSGALNGKYSAALGEQVNSKADAALEEVAELSDEVGGQISQLQENAQELSAAVEANTQDIANMKGAWSYLPAYNFGAAQPTQEQLNNYAASQGVTVKDGLTVINLFPSGDQYQNGEWRYDAQNTSSWEFQGQSTVAPATNESLGVILGSDEDLNVGINPDSTMSVNGLSDALAARAIGATLGGVGVPMPGGVLQFPAYPAAPPSEFTFIVDSDAAAAAWRSNAAGNDYTAVCVKRGEWNTGGVISLANIGTKYIYGESGSVLKSTGSGIINGGNNCVIVGVTVNTNSSYGFLSTNNLFNCKVTGSALSGFESCENIFNCDADAKTHAFYKCKNVKSCKGIVQSTLSSASSFYDCYLISSSYAAGRIGFDACEVITDCWTECTYMGYRSCKSLSNCVAVIVSAGVLAAGFSNCNNLMCCTSLCEASSAAAAAFYQCRRVIACQGVGISDTSNGYAFSACYGVSHCSPYEVSTTATYASSYASNSGTYSVADTPSGGFNAS